MNPTPHLIMLSGLPGCGKTTLAHQLARHLRIALFAKDRIQRVVNDQMTDANPIIGYNILLDLADEQLALGVSVILDAVFPMDGFRRQARQLATQYNAQFRPIYCYCSDESIWQARLENRETLVPGWPPVGWSEVERLRPSFEIWQGADILALDALHSPADNLQTALHFIQSGLLD